MVMYRPDPRPVATAGELPAVIRKTARRTIGSRLNPSQSGQKGRKATSPVQQPPCVCVCVC